MAFKGQKRLKKGQSAKLSCGSLHAVKPKQAADNCIHNMSYSVKCCWKITFDYVRSVCMSGPCIVGVDCSV